jgi:hypothetical protein
MTVRLFVLDVAAAGVFVIDVAFRAAAAGVFVLDAVVLNQSKLHWDN